jgi:hypothetical protein
MTISQEGVYQVVNQLKLDGALGIGQKVSLIGNQIGEEANVQDVTRWHIISEVCLSNVKSVEKEAPNEAM